MHYIYHGRCGGLLHTGTQPNKIMSSRILKMLRYTILQNAVCNADVLKIFFQNCRRARGWKIFSLMLTFSVRDNPLVSRKNHSSKASRVSGGNIIFNAPSAMQKVYIVNVFSKDYKFFIFGGYKHGNIKTFGCIKQCTQ